MSSIPQITDNGNGVSDFVTNFMKKFSVGKLLFKCNAGKEKASRSWIFSAISSA